MRGRVIFLGLALVTALSACGQNAPALPAGPPAAAPVSLADSLIGTRFAPPAGFVRVPYGEGTWGHFLRTRPLLPAGSPVLDYRGQPIAAQHSHLAVLAYDVGTRDLQQCADAVLRLRGEYLFAQQRPADIVFRFTSGHPFAWADYAAGLRPKVDGSRVDFVKTAKSDHSYGSFRRYLDVLFTYAGTQSLYKDTRPLPAGAPIEAGDVVIVPGSPGHCVLVADVAEGAGGQRRYLLVQSFMPAQSIHVLRVPQGGGPWFEIVPGQALDVGPYYFPRAELRRF